MKKNDFFLKKSLIFQKTDNQNFINIFSCRGTGDTLLFRR